MCPKQNYSAIYDGLKELLEDKFSQLNQRIDVIEQKLNDTHKDLKIAIGEVDKKAHKAISASYKNEEVIDELKFREGKQEEMLKEKKYRISTL